MWRGTEIEIIEPGTDRQIVFAPSEARRILLRASCSNFC